MTIAKEKIREVIVASGWEVADARTFAEHWVDEIWLIRSTWSPTDVELYLTFEIDGQASPRDTSRVWAIIASVAKPIDWPADGEGHTPHRASSGAESIHFPVTKEKHLESFVEGLDDLRNGRKGPRQ